MDEKINSIYENLKKSQHFSFFLSDKKFLPLNLEQINKKVQSNSYENTLSLFFDLNRLWNSYFVHFYNKKDYKNIKKVVEISELTEKLYSNKDDNKKKTGNNFNKTNKNNFKVRNKSEKFNSEEKTNLVYKLMALSQDQMKNVVNVLKDIKPNEKNHNFEFNVFDLSEENLLKLEEYVDKCLKLA